MHLYIEDRRIIEVEMANTSSKRILGLMFRKEIDKGLLLKPNNSIHTFFMRSSIDVVYLDKNNKVIKITEDMKPWKVGPFVIKGINTLELPPGSIKKHCIATGQVLQFK